MRHEIVHNTYVVEDLRAKGAVFIDDLDDVPPGATRGVLGATACRVPCRRMRAARGLQVFDATCPLVTKVHVEVARMRAQGREIVMIGHKGHPEVEGTMGQADAGIHLVEDRRRRGARCRSPSRRRLAYVTQTTLSLDDASAIIAALKARFPAIRRAQASRHLLRHAEPPGRGQAHRAARSRW